VNDPAGDVLVHLGSSDYLRRYKIYVTHAQGWRQQFQKLESVDLRYDNQIIVNPEIQRTAKPAPALSPAVAKAAVAAGVKPAALVTRLGPHDRAVPKPAFELTEKKLDSNTTAGAKKTAPKPKGKKTAAKAGKAAVAAKKAVATAKPGTSATAKNAAGTRVATKTSSPATHKIASQQAADAKQSPAPSSSKRIVRPSASGGQKPSPAVAKTQANSGPGL
jgi:hypothetical protein